MESMFFHPKMVHLPVALAVLMPLVSAGLLAAWWASVLPRRAWAIAVFLQLSLVASGIVALRTGEAEEERVEKVVAEKQIEEHEEAAETFVWGAGVVLALMLAASAVRGEGTARGIAAAAAVGTLVVLLLGYRTGERGGRLVYQHGAANAYVSATGGAAIGASAAAPRSRHDDDD